MRFLVIACLACLLACRAPRDAAPAAQAPAAKAPDVAPVAQPRAAPMTPTPNAERSASGLVHEALREPKGTQRAMAHDRVRVIFTGYDAEGHVIDSSKGRGGTAELAAGEGFPGLQEALQLLREGEKRRFFIPEELAYKHYPGAIRGDLVYEIELVSIVSMPAPPDVPADLNKPPKSARLGGQRGNKGIASRILQRGMGRQRPRGESSGVDVHFTCWSRAGVRVFSTVPQGRPFRAELNKLELMPGMDEAVRMMVVGERRRLWIPEALTKHAGSPERSEPLVCDLELVALYEKKQLIESSP